MTYISLFIVSFTIALSGALMPGPMLAAVVSESTRHGFKTGPLLILGHALLEIVMIVCIVFGFTHFIHNTLVFLIIGIFGGILLVLFGIAMLLRVNEMQLNLDGTDSSIMGVFHLTIKGIFLSITNPYWTIWWLTVGFGLVLAAQKQGILGICIFFTGHILADLGWFSLISYCIHKERKSISRRIYRNILIFCSLALIVFGIYFGVSSLSGFLD